MSQYLSPEFIHALARALGWTLLHSLWQGALLAGVVALVLGLLPASYARLRHGVCMLGLLLLLLGGLGTFWRLRPPMAAPFPASDVRLSLGEPEEQVISALETEGAATPLDAARTAAPILVRQRLEPLLPWLAALWGAGVVLLSLRQAFGWRRLRQWRRESEPAGEELQCAFARFAARLGRAGVVLRVSAEVATPLLAGLLKPAVILPARLLTGLKSAEIEAILAHELAHFARRDGWTHLFQIALETLFFYHPAAWWIGSCARQEREKAADDLALELCGDRRAYAGALAQLAELQLGAAPAPAATGGRVLARIERILQLPQGSRMASRWSVGVPLVFAALAAALLIVMESRLARAAEREIAEPIAKKLEELVHRVYVVFANRPATPEEVDALVKSNDPEKFSKVINKLVASKEVDKVAMSTPEGRRKLALRLYLDLTGKPPTPDEMVAFVNATEPMAYENLVKKLTAPVVPATKPVKATEAGLEPRREAIRRVYQNLIGELPTPAETEAYMNASGNQAFTKLKERMAAMQEASKTWVVEMRDPEKREGTLKQMRAAMEGKSTAEARAALMAFNQLGPIEFDKVSFRPSVRALLVSPDEKSRLLAATALTLTGAEPVDLERVLAMADNPTTEMRGQLPGIVARLYGMDLRGPAGDAVLKLMTSGDPALLKKSISGIQSAKGSPALEKRMRDLSSAVVSPAGEGKDAKILALEQKVNEAREQVNLLKANVALLKEQTEKTQLGAQEIIRRNTNPTMLPGLKRMLEQQNLSAGTRQFLVEMVAQIEKAESTPSAVEANRAAARRRGAEDAKRYSAEQLREIETLYQVANSKGKRSPEARASLKEMLEKFDGANRTGCALLYLGQGSEGAERLEYLTRAVEKHSDCFYFDGCQVGGYGRYVLALTLWERGDKEKARAVMQEIKTKYQETTDHRGRPMIEAVAVVEAEWAKQP